MPSSKGVSAEHKGRSEGHEKVSVSSTTLSRSPLALTWSKDDGIPDHEVVGARGATDASRGVGGQPLEVANETALGRRRLRAAKAPWSASIGGISEDAGWRGIPAGTYHLDQGSSTSSSSCSDKVV